MFLIGTIIWILLQVSRAIALVLINDINTGSSSEARRSLLTWVFAIKYWVISIVDHVGNFVTTTFVGAPSIAEGMSNKYLIPAIQTLLEYCILDSAFCTKVS